jgi:hypothetical protein
MSSLISAPDIDGFHTREVAGDRLGARMREAQLARVHPDLGESLFGNIERKWRERKTSGAEINLSAVRCFAFRLTPQGAQCVRIFPCLFVFD